MRVVVAQAMYGSYQKLPGTLRYAIHVLAFKRSVANPMCMFFASGRAPGKAPLMSG